MCCRGVLFTDLDGTLLDFDTYRPSPEALEALSLVARNNILTVPVSSKTAAEVRPLLRELKLPGPAVVEGGPVMVLADGSEEVVGRPRSELLEVLDRLRSTGWPLRGLSAMAVDEVTRLTGLHAEGVRDAMTRLASEPFIATRPLDPDAIENLEKNVMVLGAGIVRGGRFWHLLGAGVDKGFGMRSALATLASGDRPPTAAVGDAWNDLPMLAEADLGFLLGDRVGEESVPLGVVRLAVAGPEGFSEAVRRILRAWRLSEC